MAGIQSTIHAFERFKQRILPLMDMYSQNTISNLSQFNQLLSDLLDLKFDPYEIIRGNIRNVKSRIYCIGFKIPITIVIDVTINRVITIFSSPEWERAAHRMNSVWRCYA